MRKHILVRDDRCEIWKKAFDVFVHLASATPNIRYLPPSRFSPNPGFSSLTDLQSRNCMRGTLGNNERGSWLRLFLVLAFSI
jgi:hypothetical protein